MSQNKNWSPELDGLRGYASLWVLLGHICILTRCNIPILSNPDFGVDLFILLSGYLMAKNYIERQHVEPWMSVKTVTSFWTRRFFRIAPLYYVLLIVAFIFGETFGHYRDAIALAWPETQTETARYTDSSMANVLTHISFTFGFLPYYSFRTVLPDWSIGLEMQYYALFPFIMMLVMGIGFIRTCLALIVMCVMAAFIFPGYFSAFPMPSMILFKLPLFISGMLLYKAVAENRKIYVMVALLSPLAAFLMGYFTSPIRMIIEVMIILGMSILLMPHSDKSPLKGIVFFSRKLLSARFSQFLGDVSYSVYLLHLMIVIPIIGILVKYNGFVDLAAPLRSLLVAVISLPIVYMISLGLYQYIEKKGIMLGRKIINSKKITTSEVM
ncbi:acyltransferase family protein [Klebsiella aerogenes]|uniref:acyltransferase family protein n=1 Tax=Klebsiella aerogenes TaxID=548 RepID=UPI003699204D